LPVKRLERAALAKRLTALTATAHYSERARALAGAMEQEDGEAAAAAALGRFFGGHLSSQTPLSMIV
jgi:UDP:flavonoid glycosyltransferase YjiC (YdhE family)